MEFEFQPSLDGPYFKIRPMEESDQENLFAVASNPLIWEQHTDRRYEPEVFNDFFNQTIKSKGGLVVIDKKTGKIIGSNRFSEITGTEDAVEIGWSFLHFDYWGGKTNREVKSMLMAHAFQFVNNTVYYIDKNNPRSIKATEKLGGKLISNHLDDSIVRRNSDDLTYIIQKKNWNG